MNLLSYEVAVNGDAEGTRSTELESVSKEKSDHGEKTDLMFMCRRISKSDISPESNDGFIFTRL